jgi:hypothetical protein
LRQLWASLDYNIFFSKGLFSTRKGDGMRKLTICWLVFIPLASVCFAQALISSVEKQ